MPFAGSARAPHEGAPPHASPFHISRPFFSQEPQLPYKLEGSIMEAALLVVFKSFWTWLGTFLIVAAFAEGLGNGLRSK